VKRYELLFGPLAAAIFVFGVAGLGMLVPRYSHVHQTISEIGEVGSPAQAPFTAVALLVAFCIAAFAAALRNASIATGHSTVAAYLTGCMAISLAGVGIFAFPHPLHNVFGISELVGYQAPLGFALTWRSEPRAKNLVTFSWLMFLAIWIAIVLNLESLDPGGLLWQHVKPVIGIAQRALFGAWFVWCAGSGLLLFNRAAYRYADVSGPMQRC